MLSGNPFDEPQQRRAAHSGRASPADSSVAVNGPMNTSINSNGGAAPARPSVSLDGPQVELSATLPVVHNAFAIPPAAASSAAQAPRGTTGSVSLFSDAIPSHAHPEYNRVVLARFRVDPAFKGKEMVRAITYFPITTEILVENDASFTVPDVPTDGPHLVGVNLGVKRSDWSRGNSATVDRRYSEVMDLRELLTYQFPNLILPPLPRKTSVGDIETYFSASDAFAAQRHNLQFFLYELAAMPEIIFFSEWVAPFFLDPRDTFETGTLLRMRTALRDFRLANRAFHECSKRHRSFTEYTANRIAAKSTSIVRSVAGFFFSSSEGAEEAGNAAASVSVTAPSSTYDWTYLPSDAKADACAWVRVCEELVRRQQALKESARTYEKYLTALSQTNDAGLHVAQSLEGYESVLRSTPAFVSLGEQYHLAARLVDALSIKRRDFLDRKYVNICMRLSFESNLINAVLDAVDTLLGQYQFLSSSQLTNTHDRTQEDALRYTQAVSRALLVDYRDRYRFNYGRRMRNLVREQIVRPSHEVACSVEQVTRGSELLQVVQDASFTDVEAGAGA